MAFAAQQFVTPYCTIAFSGYRPLLFQFLAISAHPMSKLWQARFFTTVNQLRDLPDTQAPEIAFAGRSNAGKSTAINILTNQKGLAFASKTPGRTQHINYFSIGGAHVGQHRKDATIVEEIEALLVDLPGYGYAEVSGSAKLHWQKVAGRLCPAPRAARRPGADHGFAPPVYRTGRADARMVRPDRQADPLHPDQGR